VNGDFLFTNKTDIQYTPQIYLKMCIYFSGGGRLEIEVNHTLTVDGYIMANSEDVLIPIHPQNMIT
jgi:hypothetical protein